MRFASLVSSDASFRTHAATVDRIRAVCEAHRAPASVHELGTSEEGRPLIGVVMGRGPQTVSLIAGNHADEPVGPETLRTLILEGLAQAGALADRFEQFTFVIVPHTNPDGAARNQTWIEQWPDLDAYLQHVDREPPGRDLEFGFPAMRPENEHVSDFLREYAPFDLHMSLHGMAVAEGAMLLINRPWTFRTQALRDGFRAAAAEEGLRMHDHNRKGEKGFFYIEPGFSTTPRGEAMRMFFRAQGDDAMAARFHDSSMEFVMGLGGDPLCLVTEVPLFVVRNDDPTSGVPEKCQALKAKLPEAKRRLAKGDSIDDLLASFDLRPCPLSAAMRLQFSAIEHGLNTVRRRHP